MLDACADISLHIHIHICIYLQTAPVCESTHVIIQHCTSLLFEAPELLLIEELHHLSEQINLLVGVVLEG